MEKLELKTAKVADGFVKKKTTILALFENQEGLDNEDQNSEQDSDAQSQIDETS